jgi:murein DD-endopeptidase MepM/ murein hydrolase activator NlpD
MPGNHEGVDIFAMFNDPILASRDGDVIWASNRRRSDGSISDYGNHVVIDHGGGWISWSAHLDSYSVRAGDIVLQGDSIGQAGSTGNSTGVHLHFSIQYIGHGLDGYILRDVVNPGPLLGL